MSTRGLIVAVALALAAAACGDDRGVAPDEAAPAGTDTVERPAPAQPTSTPPPTTTVADLPARATVEVLARQPHDSTSFTQGLELHGSTIVESAGGYGTSRIQVLDRATGAVLASRDLDANLFGEGATVVDDQIVQLTWREGTAFVHDRETLAPITTFTYDGPGWGLCDDGSRLVMSDGTSRLTLRDRDSFEPIGSIDVTRSGVPVPLLNELECVGGEIWANVWTTDEIVRIDAETGAVLTTVDASGLLTPDEAGVADVLNGIAHDPATNTFLLTGKWWPWVFEVRFVPDTASP